MTKIEKARARYELARAARKNRGQSIESVAEARARQALDRLRYGK